MKWYRLFKKIANQELNKMKKCDVYALIEGKEVPLLLEFRADGSPYLVPKVANTLEYIDGLCNLHDAQKFAKEHQGNYMAEVLKKYSRD